MVDPVPPWPYHPGVRVRDRSTGREGVVRAPRSVHQDSVEFVDNGGRSHFLTTLTYGQLLERLEVVSASA